jgi:hypothetical protein
MVQGHTFETLLSAEARANAIYQLQVIFHGSTAPGFLFASGFVVGLPRAPLSPGASVRRARRMLFVLGVAYALHLPYVSIWKTLLSASAHERAALYACDALQVIAVSQLIVIALQWLLRERWTLAAGGLALLVMALSPPVWASGLSARVHPALGAYLDGTTGSHFPFFPFGSFVFAGTVAGALLGRQEPEARWWRALRAAGVLIPAGLLLAVLLHGWADFWTVSPAYVLVRLGGLLLILLAVERAAARQLPGVRTLALAGHETFQVFVLHLYLLYGWILGPAPLGRWVGRLDFAGAAAALLAMLPVLLAPAWAWHTLKARAPREATLLLFFVGTAFVYEFLIRPW